MKLLFDFLPIILFFGTFKYAESEKAWAADFATRHLGFMVSGGKVSVAEAPVLLATVVVIVATLAQVVWLKLRRRKVDAMLWVSLAVVVVLGLAFWLSPLLFNRNLLKVLLGEQLDLPGKVWHRLNFAWIAFFGVMGLLNIWVAYTFTTATWVNFKLFGGLGLMLLFMLAQGLWISRYLEPAAGKPGSEDASPEEPR